ncbi:MAG: NAD-dependent epimerase/dehydratase family protein [archaeon]
MRQNILVTGASGLVGKALIRCLRSSPYVLHGQYFSRPISSSSEHFHCCDLRQKQDVLRLVQKTRPRAIVHLAAVMHGNETDMHRINVEGTRSLIGAVQKTRTEHLIFMSSCAVYDRIPPGARIREEYRIAPAGCYARTKKKAEDLIVQAAKKNGFSYTIFRGHMIYDLHTDNNLSRLKNLLIRFRLVPLLAGGHFCVQPLHRDDAAGILSRSILNKGAYNKCYNLAGPDPVMFRDLMVQLADFLHLKRVFIPVPAKLALFLANFSRPGSSIPDREELVRAMQNSSYDISGLVTDFRFRPQGLDQRLRHENSPD